MLNRTIAPPVYKIKQYKFNQPEINFINDLIPLYSISMGSQPILQLELIFDSGVWNEKKPGLAYFSSNMLLEGTHKKSFHDIAEFIESCGATLEVRVNADTCSIVICTLSKFLDRMLKILVELITDSIFSEERIEHLKQLKLDSIVLDDVKIERIARKRFRSLLYSPNHPYGRSLKQEDVQNINKDDLYKHYKESLFTNCKIFISGQVENNHIDLIRKYISYIEDYLISIKNSNIETPKKSSQAKEIISHKEGLQASLCMGKILFSKTDLDFIPMLIVNTIFGGYFGSRLMRNIREKNGYTYGIHSQLVPLKHSGYLLISVEVDAAHYEDTYNEITNEIDILQNEPICKNELKTVKNYLMGMLKADMDNPLVVMEKFKSAYLYGRDEAYFDSLYDSIYNIDEQQILNIAQKYLSIDSMSCVIVK